MGCHRLILYLAVVAGLTACATDEPGISPGRDAFYFPTGLALDPVRDILYITNSNADLKFNGSTLTALDLRKLPDDLSQVTAWVKAGKLKCSPSRIDSSSWECQEGQFIQPGATIRMGDFPAGIRVTSDGSRLYVPVRGQDYLLWADIVDLNGGQVDIRCDDDCINEATNCELWDCHKDYRINYSNELRASLPDDPFGIYLNELTAVHVDSEGRRRTCKDRLLPEVDCDCGELPLCHSETDRGCCIPPTDIDHIYVAHLLRGEVSLFVSEGRNVTLRDIRAGFFSTGQAIQGSFALQAMRPGDGEGPVFLTSRVDSSLASFIVREDQTIVVRQKKTPGGVYPGSDKRGMAFGPGGERLYVVNRMPPSLVALDMSLEDELPLQEPIWAAEICAEPSEIELVEGPAGALLAYVVCFGTAQIFVVDTEIGQVIDQIQTGNGPNVLAHDGEHRRLFVSNFLENTVGVIDLDPSHPTYNRMVMRLGELEDLVRN